MSHEIRTPLNGIVGSLQMLETSPNALVSRELVGMASSSAAYLQSFIERVLETARRESTAFEIMKERFSLGEHFSITLGMVEHDFEAAGLVLTTRLDSNLPPVLVGDPVRLRQIMLNLLSNAEKYTKKGMVSVELSLVSLRNNVCELKIDVVDTGCGIPPEAHQRIFEVFSQEDNDVLKPRRGVGLGLAITKKIVKELGGEISLESAVGKGSRFTVVLPFGIDSANNDAVSPVASEVL
jgi:signal transduction histidine kinase